MENTLTLAAATAAIEDIERRIAHFTAAQLQAAESLSKTESQLGDRILDGDTAALREFREIEAHLDTCGRALAALEKRRAAAELDRRRAEIADMRRQANEKRAEIKRITEETLKPLAELAKIEGIEYDRSILFAQFGPMAGFMLGAYHGLPAPFQNPHELSAYMSPVGMPVHARYAKPRTRILMEEVIALEQRAETMEQDLEVAQAKPKLPVTDPMNNLRTDGPRFVHLGPARPGQASKTASEVEYDRTERAR